jgi:hypothetical protein
LKEHDNKETKKMIALLIQRLSKLYQIPNWTEENAIMLTEWIFENYKYETMDVISKVLTNPPNTGKQNWRLTPDTIQEWMSIELEKQAEQREKDWEKEKKKELAPPENQDSIDFAKIFAGTWVEKYEKEEASKENAWQEFRKRFYKHE